MALRETEGADPSVIYEDRHLEVMNKRAVAKKKQSAHILQESGVPTFHPELGHELMKRKYVLPVRSLSSLDKRFQHVKKNMSDVTEG